MVDCWHMPLAVRTVALQPQLAAAAVFVAGVLGQSAARLAAALTARVWVEAGQLSQHVLAQDCQLSHHLHWSPSWCCVLRPLGAVLAALGCVVEANAAWGAALIEAAEVAACCWGSV